jgi:hypothetical protein
MGLSDRSGNSGYPRLGDTVAANLQKTDKLSSSYLLAYLLTTYLLT